MKAISWWAFTAASLLGFSVCGFGADTNTSAVVRPAAAGFKAKQSEAAPKRVYPVIGHLEKQGRTITIKSGPKGPLYSIATREGKVLATDLSMEQMRAKAPELHDFLKSAVAADGAVKDASLDRPAPPQNLRINVR